MLPLGFGAIWGRGSKHHGNLPICPLGMGKRSHLKRLRSGIAMARGLPLSPLGMGKTLLPGFVAMWGLADLPIGHGEKEPFEAPALWSCDGAADLAWIAFSPLGMGKR